MKVPKIFRLSEELVEELEYDEPLLSFLDRAFLLLPDLESLKNLSNTCLMVECFLSKGFGYIFVESCALRRGYCDSSINSAASRLMVEGGDEHPHPVSYCKMVEVKFKGVYIHVSVNL